MREEIYTSEDTIDIGREMLEGKILVIPVQSFSREYRTAKYQLVRATGGFGCDPTNRGTAVFVKFLSDGEEARYSRGDFEGILKEEFVSELTNEDFPYL
jgi:hypothetical protein